MNLVCPSALFYSEVGIEVAIAAQIKLLFIDKKQLSEHISCLI